MANHPDHTRPAPDLVEAGVPATTDAPPYLDVETTEGEPAPLDRPQAVDEWGTTAAEAALRVVEEPPGLNYDPGPGYLTDKE